MLNVKETEVTFSWQTQDDTTYVLAWQEQDTANSAQYLSVEKKRDFSYTIPNLKPNTAYRYTLTIKNDYDSSEIKGEFRTFPESSSSIGPFSSSSSGSGSSLTSISTQATQALSQTFTRNLSRGSEGRDVLELQRFLASQGYLAVDDITGYFGPVTEKALQAFQKVESIVTVGTPDTTGYGNFGVLTRAKVSAMMNATSSRLTQPFAEMATATQPLKELLGSLQKQLIALLSQLLSQLKL